MKNYITKKEIIEILNVPSDTMNSILEHYKIDRYQGKKGLMINFKDFYKIYTSLYNPSLFIYDNRNSIDEKKTNGKKGLEYLKKILAIFGKNSLKDLLYKIFK